MKIADTLNKRKSVRSYTGEQITKEELDAILTAAYAAPVGRRAYDTVMLTVINNPDLLARIDRSIAEYFGDPNLHPLYGAPTLILVSSTILEPPLDNSSYSNAAIVAHNMALEAAELGVGVCHIWGAPIGINRTPELLAELNLPEGFVPCCSVTLGKTQETYELREIPANRIRTDYID